MEKDVPHRAVSAMNPLNRPVSKPLSKPGQPIFDIRDVPEGIKVLAKEQFGQRVELYTPRENGGPYKGEVVNTPSHLLQEVGPRTIIIHDKSYVELATPTLVLRDQEHRLNNTDVQIHYAGKEGKAYPLDRQKDMVDRAVGSLKKSAHELGYSKEFMAQLDAAQAQTIERLRLLRQGPTNQKIDSPTHTVKPANESMIDQPTRSRR